MEMDGATAAETAANQSVYVSCSESTLLGFILFIATPGNFNYVNVVVNIKHCS